MTWEAIARKDFLDAVRSYWLWGLTALFVVVLAMPAVLVLVDVVQIGGGQNAVTTDLFVGLMRDTMTLLVPVIAIVLAYASVAGERDSGTLKILLSLPHSRLDVVAGKALGRGAVLVLPIVAGFAVAAVGFALTPIAVKGHNFLLFAILTALLGLVFVAISVGISAGARSGRRAMIGTVGIFAVFTLFWSRSTQGLIQLLRENTGLESATLVPLHLFLRVLNPTQGYKTLVTRLFTEDATMARVSLIGGGGLRGQLNRQAYAQALGDSLPVYLSDPAVVILLLAWLVGAPLVGYAVFREADL